MQLKYYSKRGLPCRFLRFDMSSEKVYWLTIIAIAFFFCKEKNLKTKSGYELRLLKFLKS